MIPILDLKAQYESIKDEIDAAIAEVLESTQFILGPAVRDLEQRVAAYCGCKYGVGVASGTDALRLTLTARGIGPGDEVITTPFTFIATANTISHCGARPAFVDIDPGTYNIDPSSIVRNPEWGRRWPAWSKDSAGRCWGQRRRQARSSSFRRWWQLGC